MYCSDLQQLQQDPSTLGNFSVSNNMSSSIDQASQSSEYSRALLALPSLPILPLLDLKCPVANVFAFLLALFEHLQIARLTASNDTRVLLRSGVERGNHNRLLEVLQHKARMLDVDRVQLFLQPKIVPHGLRDIGANILGSVATAVHARVDHEQGAFSVRFRDASVGDVKAHSAEGGVQTGGDLGFEVEAFEAGDFVADASGKGVEGVVVASGVSADVGLDVCGEAALLAEGEVDAGRGGGVVGADLVGEGLVVGVGGAGWAGVLVEVDEAAAAFFEESEGDGTTGGLDHLDERHVEVGEVVVWCWSCCVAGAVLSTFEVACPLSRVSERLLRARSRLGADEDVSECMHMARKLHS